MRRPIHVPTPAPRRAYAKPPRQYSQTPQERLKILNYALAEKRACERITQQEHDLAEEHINNCLRLCCPHLDDCGAPSTPRCLQNGRIFYHSLKQLQKETVMLEMEIDALERIIKEWK